MGFYRLDRFSDTEVKLSNQTVLMAEGHGFSGNIKNEVVLRDIVNQA